MKYLNTILLLVIICLSLLIFTNDVVQAGCSNYGGASCTDWDCLNGSCSQFACNSTITSNMTCGSAGNQAACQAAEDCPNGCSIGGCNWTEPGCMGGPACSGAGVYCCAACGGCVNTGGLTCNQYAANGCSTTPPGDGGGDGGDGGDGGSSCYGCSTNGGGFCKYYDGNCPSWGGSCDACSGGDGDPTPSPGSGCSTILGRVMVDVNRNGINDDGDAYSIQTPGNSCGSYYNWLNNNLVVHYSGATNGSVAVNTLNDSGLGCSPPYYAKNGLQSGNHTLSLAGLTNPFGGGNWEITGVNGGVCTFNSGAQTATCNLACGSNQVWFSVAPSLSKTCTVSLSSSSINQTQTSVATIIGNSTGPISEPVRLILETAANDGFGNIYPTAQQISNPPPNTTLATSTINGVTRYYYIYDFANCSTSNGNECQIPTNIDGDTLATGYYYFHCDLATNPGRCTGNPNCTFEGLGGQVDCSANGWLSCHNGAPPTDNATLQVTCSPQCTPACGQDNGCGGTCGNTNSGPPNPPTITAPSTTHDMTGATTITATWTPPTTGPTPTAYQIKVMRQNANPDTVNCTANPTGANDAFCNTITGTSRVFTPDEQLTNQIKIAVRSINNSCLAYEPSQTSTWTTRNVSLVADITGTFYLDEGFVSQTPDLCTSPSSNTPVSLETGTAITASIGGNNYSGTLQNGNTTYHINNVPYAPSTWSNPTMFVDLDIYNSNPNSSYACSCPGNGGCQYVPGQVYAPPAPTPTYGPVNFFVSLYDFPAAWWQVKGGNVYVAEGNLHSLIPSGCLFDFTCIQYIITQDSTISVVEKSAGVPMTGGGTIASEAGGEGNAGFITQRNPQPQVGSPNGGTSHDQVPREDFEYLKRNYNLDDATQISADTITTKPIATGVQDDGSYLFYRDGSLVITPTDNQSWNVVNGEKIIFFVNGDLTFQGEGDSNNNNAFVEVEQGGFITFIAAGDIIFDHDVGHATLSETDPVVTGVFVASDMLIIEANTNGGVADKKFIGEGSFVGWNGVELQRDYDDGNLGALNNHTNPTETFIFRPDFVYEAPQRLLKPGLSWQEINYAEPQEVYGDGAF